jgi:hypothetical protein
MASTKLAIRRSNRNHSPKTNRPTSKATAPFKDIAISRDPSVEAVAQGYEPIAVVPGGGIAVSIGIEPSAMAGKDGWLVFVDTGGGEPAVKICKVDRESGLEENIPYWWRDGMDYPEIDYCRIMACPLE